MPDDFPNYLEFIPMLWHNGNDHASAWFNNANNALSRGSGHLIAFNEPDACGSGQSCMTPPQAVDAYRTYMMPLANEAALGAPAVTNGPNGMNWLSQFLSLCGGCKIDFVPVHWYDSAINEEYFYSYMQNAHKVAGGRQLWITELNGYGSEQQQASFLQQVMPWMDQQSYIYRYSWFWCDPNFSGGAIVDQNGNSTQLGGIYAYTPY